MRFRYSNGDEQVCVLKELQVQVPHISHHITISGHAGGLWLYTHLKRSLYCPEVAVNGFSFPDTTRRAQNIFLLRKHNNSMHLLQALAPLEFVASNILGELIKTPRGNRILPVIADRFSKLTRTVPIKTITAASVSHSFVTNWMITYDPPI